MSRTIRREKRKDRFAKFEDKRTGWYGEFSYTPDGVRSLKREEHKHNRRVGRKQETESYHAA